MCLPRDIISVFSPMLLSTAAELKNQLAALLDKRIPIILDVNFTAVWTRIEMCRDFFVKASLTFFDQIILPIRNQMVGKV